MASTRITAVIPTYRRPGLLRRSLEAVLAQTYPHLEVLVSDNASGDETPQVVEAFRRRDPRVRYVCNDRNMGPTWNIRSGVEQVRTEYFSILSDDDVLLPHFYRRAMSAFTAHPEAELFCGRVVQYNDGDGTHNIRPSRGWRDGLHEAGRWAPRMSESFFIWTGCVFSRRLRDEIGPPEDVHTTDELYVLRAAARFPFVVDLDPCAIFCHTGANWSTSMTPDMLMECYGAIRKACAELPNVTEQERGQVRDNVDRHYRIAANGILRAAVAAGDRRAIKQTAAFLVEHGWLQGWKRTRAALAGQPPPLGWIVSRMTKLSAGYKRMRRSRWRRMRLDELIEEYAGRTGRDSSAPAPSSPTGAGLSA